jgi:DNA-binding transcriptional regulator YhcF (GntR family)
MSSRGFTQVPNFILENEKLSVGAKMTYSMMLRYAWANDHCFPGQKTLAKDAGMGVRSVVRYIKELEETGFITIKRRGLGKVNIYELRQRVKKQA